MTARSVRALLGLFWLGLLAGGCENPDCKVNGTCTGPVGSSGGDAGSAGSSAGMAGAAGSSSGDGGQAGEAGSSGSGASSSVGGSAGTDGGAGGTGAVGGSADAGSGGSSGSDGTGAVGGEGAGGAGSGGLAGAAGSGGEICVAASMPWEDACVTSELYGIFVSPTGNDAVADGSRAKPFSTLNAAFKAAHAAEKRVYACASVDAYTESLTIEAALDGLTIFGGFSCVDWSYDRTRLARLESSEQTALKVRGLVLGLELHNFDVRAGVGAGAGGSSIAVSIELSRNVRFLASHITAANANAGADGATSSDAGKPGAAPAVRQDGRGYSCSAAPLVGGDWPLDSACGSRGGPGGHGNLSFPSAAAIAGSNGVPAIVGAGANAGKGGATAPDGSFVAKDGNPGAPGLAGAHGEAALAQGQFFPEGYTAPAGGHGEPGGTGQGGGGGGGTKSPVVIECQDNLASAGSSGAAGGMGGCGGGAGRGGGGGGASIALLSWDSQVALEDCLLTSGAGGMGGQGGAGALGGKGGAGGKGTTGANHHSGDGGPGGAGGDGGCGAGAPGGPSFGIVHHGAAPSLVNSVLVPGAGGLGGKGGNSGVSSAPDGASGQSLDSFEIEL